MSSYGAALHLNSIVVLWALRHDVEAASLYWRGLVLFELLSRNLLPQRSEVRRRSAQYCWSLCAVPSIPAVLQVRGPISSPWPPTLQNYASAVQNGHARILWDWPAKQILQHYRGAWKNRASQTRQPRGCSAEQVLQHCWWASKTPALKTRQRRDCSAKKVLQHCC